MSGVVRAGCLGVVCCLVLGVRVFVAMDPVRIRVATEPRVADSGVVRVIVEDDRLTRLDPSTAVIARVRHDAGTQTFSIRIDGTDVCTRAVSSGRARRIDCAWNQGSPRSAVSEVLVRGPEQPWTLEYLELATHHGSSSGLLQLFVMPAGSERGVVPHPLWPLLLWVVLTTVFLLPVPVPGTRWRRWRNGLPVASAIALFGVVLLLPWVSPYRVVLSVTTFVAMVVVAIAPRLWWGMRSGAPFAAPVELAVAVAMTAVVVGVGIAHGARGVSISDSYAYASQADLWLAGELRVDQSFALEAPWPDAARTFAPLGYRPHPDDARLLVPVYPPGLPMLLAVAKSLGGQRALFFVVPICAGLFVLATYGFGRRLGGGAVGLAAAWLVATSPAVIVQSVVVMTDVPVAAAWAGALFFLTGATTRSALAAGVLSGVAVLIRPNLVPLAAVLACFYLTRAWPLFAAGPAVPAERPRAGVQLMAFVCGAAPSAVLVAVLHTYLYGSPLESGYGPVAGLFDLARVPLNLRQYVTWFAQTHTVFALAGLIAVFVPVRWVWPRSDRRVLVVAAAFVAVLWLLYSAWLVFDTWLYTRFLLASWPVIMAGVGAIAMALARFRPVGGWAAVLVVVLGVVNISTNAEHGTLTFGRMEERGVATARFVRSLLPPESVVLTVFHSGTLRYYGGITTLNYSWMDAASLDRAVEWLRARGVRVYALLDDAEFPDFRRRFDGTATFAALDGRRLAVLQGPSKTTVFELGEGPPPASVITAAEEQFSPTTVAEPVPFVRPVLAAAVGTARPSRVP